MRTADELAVIVCTRDRPEMLRGCLASIVAATDPSIEVVVVDSASRGPATRDVVEEAGMRYVRSEIPGLSIARNLGLASTQRPLVVYTDDDCRAAPDWIAPLLDAFGGDAVGAVAGSMLDELPDDVDPAALAPRTVTRTRDGLDAGHGALMAFDRRLVLDLGGFDDVLGAGRTLAGAEDLDMFCRVLRAGRSVVIEPRSIVHHAHTRENEAYAALHRGYGLGLGGMLNKWVRAHPSTGFALTWIVMRRAVVGAIRASVPPRDPRQVSASRALLRGVVDGFRASTLLRLDGDRFIDDNPPTPPAPENGRAVQSRGVE